jgi:hypothetical protein
MRKVILLVLLSLTSLQFTLFVAAQGPRHPDIKRRGRESASADKPGKWNRERKEDVKRGPEKESVDMNASAVIRGLAIKSAPGIDARIGPGGPDGLKAELLRVVISASPSEEL